MWQPNQSIFFSNCHESFFWQESKQNEFSMNNVADCEGILYQYSKKTKIFCRYYFSLEGNKFSRMSKDGKPHCYTMLQLETLIYKEVKKNEEYKHCIIIRRGKKEKRFYSDKKADIIVWESKLKKFCVLNDFEKDFTLLGQISKGSTATVYRAKYKKTGSLYAAKFIAKCEIYSSKTLLERIISEITSLREINHPYIAKLYDVYESYDSIIMIVELVQGDKLTTRLTKVSKYPEAKAAIVVRKLLEILCTLEYKGILHRDIKLDNILLVNDDDTSIKLTNFGFSSKVNKINVENTYGTPGYMAPEILNKDKYDYKADIFSVGILLYSLLSGTLPVNSNKFPYIIDKNKQYIVNYPDKEWIGISIEAKELINKMLQIEPQNRISCFDCLKSSWIKMHTYDMDNQKKLKGLEDSTGDATIEGTRSARNPNSRKTWNQSDTPKKAIKSPRGDLSNRNSEKAIRHTIISPSNKNNDNSANNNNNANLDWTMVIKSLANEKNLYLQQIANNSMNSNNSISLEKSDTMQMNTVFPIKENEDENDDDSDNQNLRVATNKNGLSTVNEKRKDNQKNLKGDMLQPIEDENETFLLTNGQYQTSFGDIEELPCFEELNDLQIKRDLLEIGANTINQNNLLSSHREQSRSINIHKNMIEYPDRFILANKKPQFVVQTKSILVTDDDGNILDDNNLDSIITNNTSAIANNGASNTKPYVLKINQKPDFKINRTNPISQTPKQNFNNQSQIHQHHQHSQQDNQNNHQDYQLHHQIQARAC